MSASTAGRDAVPIEMWAAIAGLVRRWAIAEFVIEGEPVSWQRAGRNVEERITYTPKATRDGKRAVVDAFSAARPGWTPDPDLAFGIYLELRAAMLTRRDGDNMLKLIMDGLNKVCWVDDWQVAEFHVRLDRGVADPHTSVIIYRAAANIHRKARTRRPRPVRQPITVTPMLQRRTFNVIAAKLAAGDRPTLSAVAAAVGLATAADAGDVVAALVAGGFIDHTGSHFMIRKPFVRESVAATTDTATVNT